MSCTLEYGVVSGALYGNRVLPWVVLLIVQIKTVFVGLFYSAIVPTGLAVTAVAMLTLYWVDKYSLLRQWKRPPVSTRSTP